MLALLQASPGFAHACVTGHALTLAVGALVEGPIGSLHNQLVPIRVFLYLRAASLSPALLMLGDSLSCPSVFLSPQLKEKGLAVEF